MKKFIFKLFIVFLVVYGAWVSFVEWGKYYYAPNDFVSWRYKHQLLKAKGFNPEQIIIGDSLAESAINPKLISKNLYNLAQSGFTPVDTYYYLKKYLESGKTPKTVYMGFGMTHWQRSDVFREHTIGFGFLSYSEFNDLLESAGESPLFYDPSEGIEFFKDWFPFSLYYEKFVKEHEKFVAKVDFLLFRTGLSPLLIGHIKTVMFELFSPEFETHKRVIMEDLKGNEGRREFFESDSVTVANPIVDYDHFSIHPLNLIFFQKIKSMLDKNQIELKMFWVPNNETTGRLFTTQFHQEMENYFETSKEWIGIRPSNQLKYLPIEEMADMDHVNEQGMRNFSQEFKHVFFEN